MLNAELTTAEGTKFQYTAYKMPYLLQCAGSLNKGIKCVISPASVTRTWQDCVHVVAICDATSKQCNELTETHFLLSLHYRVTIVTDITMLDMYNILTL